MVFTYEEMKEVVSSKANTGIVVIDVRRDDERKAERIPGTRHVPRKCVERCTGSNSIFEIV